MVEKFIPDDVDKYARDFIETMRSGDVSAAIDEFDPSVLDGDAESLFEKISSYMSAGDVLSTKLLTGRFTNFIPFKGGNTEAYKRYFMEYYVQYSSMVPGVPDDLSIPEPDKDGKYHQIININVDKKDDEKIVYGFHVNYLPASPSEMNTLNLEEKPFWMILFLIGMIFVPVFILYTLWVCIRTPMKRRWLWVLFILFGFGKLVLNWTTGQISLNVLSIQLVGAGFVTYGLASPWYLMISLPLGAIFFHIYRASWSDGDTLVPATGEQGSAVSRDSL